MLDIATTIRTPRSQPHLVPEGIHQVEELIRPDPVLPHVLYPSVEVVMVHAAVELEANDGPAPAAVVGNLPAGRAVDVPDVAV